MPTRKQIAMLKEAEHFSPAHAARIVDVKPQAVAYQVDSGGIETVVRCGRQVIPRAELEKWIARREGKDTDDRRAHRAKMATA